MSCLRRVEKALSDVADVIGTVKYRRSSLSISENVARCAPVAIASHTVRMDVTFLTSGRAYNIRQNSQVASKLGKIKVLSEYGR